MNDIYKILENIRRLGSISVYYEVYCNSCHEFTGIGYETINKIPEYSECEHCGKELNLLKDIVVIYKVTQDE
ncbi:response regulator [Paenibacillus nuruki]|uniref:response regulator n=1 Tax=Paenibacillus nuruki TaxID=1886670 RepID=UPI002803CEF5|nr:response regulator [Paenibacillus nuruki]